MIVLLLIIGISLLILIHELGHFLAAKWSGLRVEEFGFGFPPRLLSKKIGETRYSLNALPFGGFVRIFGEHSSQLEGKVLTEEEKKRSFVHQPAYKRLVIIGAGVVMNILLGWLILSIVFMSGAPKTVVITEVAPASPAMQIGLMPGDQFVDYETISEFSDVIQQHLGEPITLAVRHKGDAVPVTVTPRKSFPENEGALGVAISEIGFDRLPVLPALLEGLKAAGSIVVEILRALGSLILGLFTQGKIAENVVGPVGIFAFAGDLKSLGIIYVLQTIGLISLNLAVLNAMPFPALDGGRFLFILIEKIKGSPLNPKKEMWVNIAGFGLLLLLMLAVTAKDIIKLL